MTHAPDADPIQRFVEGRIGEGRMPGAAWCVVRGGEPVRRGAAGQAAIEPQPVALAVDTPFDLASLTKPLATAPLLVLLEREGRLDLEAPAGDWLEELSGSPYAVASLLSLASHTSGLPAWWPLYLEASSLEGFVAAIAARPPATDPGTTLYSDLGYILLGAILERATGHPLDRLFDQRVSGPLGLSRTAFARPAGRFADAAATERDNGYERSLAGARGKGHGWRRVIPRGQVHDANAHALGGVAGHAGLFAPLDEVVRLTRELLQPRVLPFDARARRRLFEVVPASRGRTVGMQQANEAGATRGILPDAAVGHTGFTGTSLWLDPQCDAIYVLLTNRVHPSVPKPPFQSVRRGFHRLAQLRPHPPK